ncbi:hypothetical protein DRN46_04715 [Thermococci archaeon]|nr:MAG: hypothetical protein DRN46_04715 [Thermococci archaeon]
MTLVLFDKSLEGQEMRSIMNEENLREILKETFSIVSNCTCGPETSYGCLRAYDNQFCHELLRRGLVLNFLERVLPEELINQASVTHELTPSQSSVDHKKS